MVHATTPMTQLRIMGFGNSLNDNMSVIFFKLFYLSKTIFWVDVKLGAVMVTKYTPEEN